MATWINIKGDNYNAYLDLDQVSYFVHDSKNNVVRIFCSGQQVDIWKKFQPENYEKALKYIEKLPA